VTKLPADPTLAIAGLEVGEYIIYETVVPVGYLASSALTNGLKFIVYDYTWLDSDQPGEPAGLDVDDHHNLFNDKAGELPNTGGSGLWIVGAIVVAAFGAMFGFHFFNRKLQSKHEKHNDSI
jgi:LPXTG-motif cell wall-anchored protein